MEDIIADDTIHAPSPELQEKIDKLIQAEKAQKKRTWSYYEKMRKEDPDQYHNPMTRAQMLKDYQALGKDFQTGNFFEVRS